MLLSVVNPVMSKAMFEYLKVICPTKEGNTYKIFKCLEDASEEGLKKGVNSKKEVSVKKSNVITVEEKREYNNKICAMIPDIPTTKQILFQIVFLFLIMDRMKWK